VIVDAQTIKEMQQAYRNNRLGVDFGIDEPYSLGDEELDLFLASPEDWCEDNFWNSYKDLMTFARNPKEWMDEWSYDEDPNEWTDGEKEDLETIKQELQEFRSMQQNLNDAIENGDGDLGEYWVDLRDGNHRAFGAIAAGEPYVWVRAIKDRTEDGVKLE
jgi:hypothetical protein